MNTQYNMENFDDPFGEETYIKDDFINITITGIPEYDGIPVTYNGELVGRSFDGGSTIHFLNDRIKEKIGREMLNRAPTYISSRRIGQTVDDHIVNETTTEFNIINIDEI